MILPSMISEVMSHEITINSDEDIVTRLVRIFKECEQVSCVSEAALRSDDFERAKEILCLLGRTMWLIMQERILEYEIVDKKHSDCWDMDHKYQTMTMKTSVMREIFWKECEDLKSSGKKRTCFSVFAGFLESLQLGQWEGDLYRTNVVDVNEYAGSSSETIIIDSSTSKLFPGCQIW
jgi:hypothetical protein